MGTRTRGSVVASAVLAALSWAAPAPAAGQAWTPTRTPDGQPDIQGIWIAGPGANTAGHSSRGRWEGHTLVVETTNFRVDPVGDNKQPWIDSHGTFYTDALRVVERWRVVNANRIDYEATIEDSRVFTQPWKIAYEIVRHGEKNYEFIEEACWEGVSITNRLDAGRMAVRAGKTGIHSHQER